MISRVRPAAHEDVDRIASYIALDRLSAALAFMRAAEQAFKFLATTPGAGPRVEPAIQESPALRFWPISGFRNYLVLYHVLNQQVEILRVIHGARDLAIALRQSS
jgi:toxin ParE1/3/4